MPVADEDAALIPAKAEQSCETDMADMHSVAKPEQNDDPAWSFPTPEEIRAELSAEFTKEEKEKVWTEAAEAVKTYHEDLVRRWKEEMDTLLVYAGLFSAVLTAFNVQSYQLLQPGSTDSTVALLHEISSQLSSFTITPHFVNSTRDGSIPGHIQSPFHAPTSAVWLNTLWFSSLVFSLASASIALFVKQWLHEATVQGNLHESARLRQYRLNGLLKWRVGTIVMILPILLQLASVLFLAGLVVLLWTLHTTVAAITSSLAAILFTSFLTVTVLPVLKSDCSYRSPASFAIYAVLRYTRNEGLRMVRDICKVIYRWSMQWEVLINIYRAQFDRLGIFAHEAYDNMPTWRGRDQNEIYLHHGDLSRAIVTTAYCTTTDTKFLSSMPVIFSDLPPDQVPRVFGDIYSFMETEWGHWHLPDRLLCIDTITLPLCATYGIRHMLARSDKGTDRWRNDVQVIFRHYFVGKQSTEKLAELACKTLCHYAVEDRVVFGGAYTTLKKMYRKQGARHSYDTLAHAQAMYEVEMAAWDPSRGWKSFRNTMQAVYVLLHCIRAAVSGQSQLTSSQTDAMLGWGQQELFRVQEWLRGFEWVGLHKGCLAISGDAAAVLAFPHIASRYLIKNIINPLIDLCSMPGGLALVSAELVSTIEHTWSSGRLAYPNLANEEAGFVWCDSGLNHIDSRLEELKALVGGCPA
ncbi:hypothetical protein K466DRAFT_587126 [Polyporus arcularius HHB13444]|uniref:DUF6535 domain-containing protein n=1 Tax=Polyporus arcularius HHB13444 TaxID=1314778 RepID=A0A5C3PB69_9APHY|nr:hypothetical protein K466DRAFT_587126 [Polyporus arcularius HHB13444]